MNGKEIQEVLLESLRESIFNTSKELDECSLFDEEQKLTIKLDKLKAVYKLLSGE